MNERELFEMLTDIEDVYIEEAYAYQPKKHRVWARIAAVAACVALVVATGYGWYQYSQPSKTALVYPMRDETVHAFDPCLAYDRQLTFKQFAAEADLVVCGDVTTVEVLVGEKYDYMRHYVASVKVRETFKGDIQKGETVTVRENGYGHVAEDGATMKGYVTMCGGPIMREGNRVVLFLRLDEGDSSADQAVYRPINTSGKFYLDSDGLYHNSALYNTEQDEKVILLQADLADLEPKTLDQIRALIFEEGGLVYPQIDEVVTLLDDSALPDKVYSLPGLTNEADAIVMGDVTAVKCIALGNGAEKSIATITILNTLKGSTYTGDTIEVCDNGVVYVDGDGEVTGKATYCGGPFMEKGHRVLLFLNKGEDGVYTITTQVSGKFFFGEDTRFRNSMNYAAVDVSWDERSRLSKGDYFTLTEFKNMVGRLLS